MASDLISLIDQTIEHGSVWLALQKNAFTVRQLLDRLLELTPGPNLEVAYRHACVFGTDEDQVGLDGTHFLASRTEPSFSAIFVLSGRKVLHEETKGRLVPGLTDLATDPRFAHRIRILCDSLQYNAISNSEIALIIRAHSRTLFRLLVDSGQHRPINISEMLACDWMEQLPSLSEPTTGDSKVLPLLLARAKHLFDNAPLYWSKVACVAYTPLFRQSLNNGSFQGWTQDEFIKVLGYVPHLIDPNVNPTEMSPLAFRIWVQPAVISAYLLGYPIHQMVPSRRQLDRTLLKLSQDGPSAYTEELHRYQEAHPGIETSITEDNLLSSQTEDLLGESVFDYGSFDRVVAVIDEHVFYFTRPEFASLLESKQNHWSNLPLPTSVLETIRSRVNLAKAFHLPAPATVTDLLGTVNVHQEPQSSSRSPPISGAGDPNRRGTGPRTGFMPYNFGPPSSGRTQGPVAPRAQGQPEGFNFLAAVLQQAIPALFDNNGDWNELLVDNSFPSQ